LPAKAVIFSLSPAEEIPMAAVASERRGTGARRIASLLVSRVYVAYIYALSVYIFFQIFILFKAHFDFIPEIRTVKLHNVLLLLRRIFLFFFFPFSFHEVFITDIFIPYYFRI